MKRHSELEIKTLQNAPRDAAKLRRLLEVKQRQKEEAMHIEDTQRLVTEIEMLKVVWILVSRKSSKMWLSNFIVRTYLRDNNMLRHA